MLVLTVNIIDSYLIRFDLSSKEYSKKSLLFHHIPC